MYLNESADFEADLAYFESCLEFDEEGYPLLFNEETEEYEYVEDEASLELIESLFEDEQQKKPGFLQKHGRKIAGAAAVIGAGALLGRSASKAFGKKGIKRSIKTKIKPRPVEKAFRQGYKAPMNVPKSKAKIVKTTPVKARRPQFPH